MLNIKILDKANVWYPPVINFIINLFSNDEINFGVFWEVFEPFPSSLSAFLPKENTLLLSIKF